MIVGWVSATRLGLRIYPSQRGRYFRDLVWARSRERVVLQANYRRGCERGRREPYLMGRQHLQGLRIAVRIWRDGPGAA